METQTAALLVDDDPHVTDILRLAVAGKRLTLDVAYNLPTAIRCLDSSRYSVVIVDLELPQGSGFDVLRYMSGRRIALPTVVISRNLTESVRQMLAREHVKLILAKPVKSGLLVTVVLGLCNVGESGRDRRYPAPDELRDANSLRRGL
jgi:two-component system response regulator PilR (NtrC family)